jgi:single-stranded DNA-specific DHH superfamily exonuclease
MLTKKQIDEIKGFLDGSQNPLFFFDNDLDGLCSFLLLSRYADRGKGVPVKSYPDLNESYFRKINELNPDAIFILDKHKVSEEFFDKAHQLNLPVVWIDHHLSEQEIPEWVHYYNPLLNKHIGGEPVTYLCYQVTQKKEDLWIALMGCIADNYFPDFYPEFKKNFPDMGFESNSAFEILYSSEIGKIVRMLNFGLKDTTSNVVKMLKFMQKARDPHDILEINSNTYNIHKRFEQISNRYNKLLSKAIQIGTRLDRILFFQYGGDLSLSADLANELYYKFPSKIIVIAYVKSLFANISLRGKGVREVTLEAIHGLEDATGGGHEDATGAKVLIEDLPEFKKRIRNILRE